MLNSGQFYNYFQLNHFDYKQEANRSLLDMDDKTFENTFKGIIDKDRKDFNRTLKMDIRFTFLLSVETLFEFIFALLPSKNGTFNDKRLLQRLAEKRYNNSEIRKFAKDEDNILDNYLWEKVYYSNGKENTLLQHLFYPGVDADAVEYSIEDSLQTIYKSLKILGLELANRVEINSFKHGFKGIPFFQSFGVNHPQTNETILEVDVEDSITNYVWNPNTRQSRFETNTFDWERDINLTNWTSNLLHNIIQCRKSMFDEGKGKPVNVIFFKEENLSNAKKVNVRAQNFTLTLEHEE